MLHALYLSLIVASGDVAHDVVRSADGVLFTVTNASVFFAPMHRVMLVPGESEEEPYQDWGRSGRESGVYHPGFDPARIAGPLAWGVCDGSFYSVAHMRDGNAPPGTTAALSRFPLTQIDAIVQPIPEIIEIERHRRQRDATYERSEALINNIHDHQRRHGNRCRPLMEYIVENAESLNQSWDLSFDEVYLALDRVIMAANRGGRMHVWELQATGDGNAPWTGHHPFATPIRGVFRILRGGTNLANLYFVDETGSIHIGFGAEHRKIGTVRDYHHADETTLTLLFEDQMTEKIGFLHAAEDGTITVLPIDWQDETFAADFLTELDADRTRAGVVRLAEVLREDAEDGGGDG